MGQESKNDYTLYMGDVPIGRGQIQFAEITLPPKKLEPVKEFDFQCMEFTLHVKTPKRWRCGSRKRYIKLIMSEGLSRNYAERLAYFVRMVVPYREAWRNHLLHKF